VCIIALIFALFSPKVNPIKLKYIKQGKAKKYMKQKTTARVMIFSVCLGQNPNFFQGKSGR